MSLTVNLNSARSGTLWADMAYQYFLSLLESVPPLYSYRQIIIV